MKSDFLVIYENAPSDMGHLPCVLMYHGCRWDELVRYGDTKKKIEIEKYKGVISLGGEGKENENDQEEELELLKKAMDLGLGVLGICQGAQNVIQAEFGKADTLDQIVPGDEGLTTAILNNPEEEDEVISPLRDTKRVCQGHTWKYILPDDTRIVDLARSGPDAPLHSEAFRLGQRVYGLQFHPEVPSTEIPQWVKDGDEVPNRAECVDIARAGWKMLDAWIKIALRPPE